MALTRSDRRYTRNVTAQTMTVRRYTSARALRHEASVGWRHATDQLPLTGKDFVAHKFRQAVCLHLGGWHELELDEAQLDEGADAQDPVD